MIIKQEKRTYKHMAKREQIKFAFFPVKLKKSIYDRIGAWIWLEKYVNSAENHNDESEAPKWIIFKRERLSDYTLSKLSRNANND